MPMVRAYTESLWGRNSPYVPLVPKPVLATNTRVKARMPTAEEKRALHARDGFHCRFCGMPLVQSRSAAVLDQGVSGPRPLGDRKPEPTCCLPVHVGPVRSPHAALTRGHKRPGQHGDCVCPMQLLTDAVHLGGSWLSKPSRSRAEEIDLGRAGESADSWKAHRWASCQLILSAITGPSQAGSVHREPNADVHSRSAASVKNWALGAIPDRRLIWSVSIRGPISQPLRS